MTDPSEESMSTPFRASQHIASLPDFMVAGTNVFAFYRMQYHAKQNCWLVVRSAHHGHTSPPIGWSDKWMQGRLVEDFAKSRYKEHEKDTWPLVEYFHRVFYDRANRRIDTNPVVERVRISDMWIGTESPRPVVTFFAVRWSDPEEANDWDSNSWGHTGSSISDAYSLSLSSGAAYHYFGPHFECLTAFIRDSSELDKISEHYVYECLLSSRARHLAGLYFLWASAFEDRPAHNCAGGFVRESSYFSLLQRMESIGVPTRFPHPSHLHRTIVSKDLYSHLCLMSELRLPKCVKVSRSSVIKNSMRASRMALSNLKILMNGRELKLGGVTKLGFSWEAMDVRAFDNEVTLASQLEDLFNQYGCQNDSVFVQERVPNVLEMRMIAVDGVVKHVTYSKFHKVSEDGLFRDFERTASRTDAANKWLGGDVNSLAKVEETTCKDCIRSWQKWMLTECEEIPSALRYDFIVGYGSGGNNTSNLTCYVGELCEMGFSVMDYPMAEKELFWAITKSAGNGETCDLKEACPLGCFRNNLSSSTDTNTRGD